MIVAGIGCRKGTDANSIEEAIDAALAEAALPRTRLDALATHEIKRSEPGLVEIAERWALTLMIFTTAELVGSADHIETRSERVVALTGVPSVAEAAALTGAGQNSRLLSPRVTNGNAACAIAEGDGRTEARP